MGINYTPVTWTTGQNLTATLMNAQINTPFTGLQAAWDTYTPVWTSSGTAPSRGNGTLTGKFWRCGLTIHYKIRLVIGSSTNLGSGRWDFTLPDTNDNEADYTILGASAYHDVSTGNNIPGATMRYGSGNCCMINTAGTSVGAGALAWDTGDILSLAGVFEATS